MKAENLEGEEGNMNLINISSTNVWFFQNITLTYVKPSLYSYLRVYQGSEGQVIEQVCEVLPNIGVTIFP